MLLGTRHCHGVLSFVEVANQNDCTARLLGNGGETFGDIPNFIGAVHVHVPAQVALERVEDHQLGIAIFDRFLYAFIQQGEGVLGFVDADNAVEVSACVNEPEFDGITQTILCGLVEDVDGVVRLHSR